MEHICCLFDSYGCLVIQKTEVALEQIATNIQKLAIRTVLQLQLSHRLPILLRDSHQIASGSTDCSLGTFVLGSREPHLPHLA